MIAELFRQEALKLFSQRYPWLLLAVLAALQTARTLVAALQPPATALDLVSAPQAWADGMGWALRLLVFVVLVVGAMGFSHEFSLGTAKTLLVLPLRRGQWFAAKLLSVVALAWAVLLACALLGAVLVAFTTGWGDVVRAGVVMHPAASYWRELLGALALTAVFLLPLAAFALLVGLHFSSSGAAVGVAVLLGTVLESGAGLLDAGRYLFIFHLHRPLELVAKLGKGLAYRWEPELSLGLPVTLASFAVLALWGWLRLERMDVTG
jgi:ABC-2 type transport system permease protein